MRIAIWSVLAFAASPAWAGYQYYVNDSLTSVNPLAWNSSGQLSPGAAGLAVANSTAGSLISRVPAPGGGVEGEIALTIGLKQSGGVYTAFLQASSDARTGNSAGGSYLAFEMQNPQFDADKKYCSANFLLMQSVSGKVNVLSAFSHSCRDGMRLRMAVRGGTVLLWPDQPDAMEFYVGATTPGQPGLGAYSVPSGNAISLVQIGTIDATAPSALDVTKLIASVFRTRVELRWQAVADDAAGIGLAGYWVYRDGLYLGRTSKTYFKDETVAAGEKHTYSVSAVDGHLNFAAATPITVAVPTEQLTAITATPPAVPPPGRPTAATTQLGRPIAHVTAGTPQADSGGGLDPRRIGVRALGSYWGGAGENIDAVSGNLNLTVPLLSPTSRNGTKIPIALSYNSQIWRKDANGVILLGQDTGFGLGWKLQAGSITPVWNVSGGIDHYIFNDSTGAEYSLSVNSGNVWTSQEGIYVSFDANTDRLYFPDGSYWWMGSISSAAEDDAGTMYPANFYDTNGNVMSLVYARGKGSGSYYTSARLIYIYDARLGTGPAYIFAYNDDPTPHLVAEQGVVTPAESYNFTYAENQPLYEPFYGSYVKNVALLQTATSWMGPGSSFSYVPSYGELQQYTTPLGGNLQWQYRTFTYPSGIGLREVQTRYLQASASDSWHSYGFYHDDACCSLHTWSAVLDNEGKAWRYWQFVTSGTGYGLESGFWELHPTTNPPTLGQWTTLRWRATGWSTGNGNLYVSGSNTAVCDVADTNCQWADSTQVLDSYGNLTDKYLYDYGNSTSWARHYYMYYLTDPNYTSRYIRNRLTSATLVQSNGWWTTLAQNTYDQYSTSCNGQSGLVARNGVVAHDDTNYGSGFIYRGNLTSSTSPGGSVAMQYESTGVTVCTQNGAGQSVTASPSSSTNYSLPGTITPNGPSSLTSTFSYNSMWAATSVVDPNGSTATTTYDSWGRPSGSSIPDGAQTTYSYSYYPSANQQTAMVMTTGGAVERWQRTTLDGFGRVTKVESGTGATTNTPVSQVDTQYAPAGCSPIGPASRVSNPYAGGGSPTAWTTYAYDERGRSTSVTKPDGSVTQSIYIANQIQTWDAALKWKTQTFDAFGNLANVTEPDTSNGFNNSTTYTYNALNQLTNVNMQTASGTQTRSFSYSGLDRTSETNPENGTVAYTYDGAHHVLTKTDAIGQQTHYSYDAYGRLTGQYFYPLVGGVPQLDSNQTVLYNYDANPHEPGFSTHALGRLTAVQMHSSWWYEYDYSPAGRIAHQRLQIAGHNYDASYGWDTEGRLSSQTWPSAVSPSTGPQYTFQYDTMGRVGSMLDASNNTLATASYGVANELLGLTYFGMSETRTYNNLLQLIHQYVPGGAIDMQYIYTPGQNNGRIVQSIDGYMPETVNYTYDSLNRLSNAAATNGAYSQSYTYDGFGNLTSKSAAGFYPAYSATFNPATNRQNGVAYDANGNQTANGTYDVSNRLVTSSIGQSYAYDYRGKRIVKWLGSSAEVYFYGIDGKKLTTLTCDNSLNCSDAAYNVSFAGKLVKSKGNTVVTDRLGSVRWSSLGGVTGYIYFPYGEERTITSDNREKFGTYTRDSSGQDYADQRYYGVGTGRFLSVDPGGMGTANPANPMSWNRYGYASGDPANRFDPTGRYDYDTDPDFGDCGGGLDVAFCVVSPDQTVGGGNGAYNRTSDEVTGVSFEVIDGYVTTVPVIGDPNIPDTVTVDAASQELWSVSWSTSAPGVVLGGFIGELLGGPQGAGVGAVLGSMCGAGVAGAYVPGTNSVYIGVTANCAPMLNGGSGYTLTTTTVPSNQDPNQIANGTSATVTYQPTRTAGSTITYSPGSGPPVVGVSTGSRAPVSVGVGWNICIWRCH